MVPQKQNNFNQKQVGGQGAKRLAATVIALLCIELHTLLITNNSLKVDHSNRPIINAYF